MISDSDAKQAQAQHPMAATRRWSVAVINPYQWSLPIGEGWAAANTLTFLIVARNAWRFAHKPPALPESMSLLIKRGAVVGHLLLNGIALLMLPISGWYWSTVADKPILVAGIFMLAPLVDPNPELNHLEKTFTPERLGLVVRWEVDIC
ncbi:cytochrome b [Pseudomonas rhizophila]